MKPLYLLILTLGICISCDEKSEVKTDLLENDFTKENKQSKASQIAELKEAGYQIFDYVDKESGDTIIMQEYYMAFLKRGPNRNQSKTEADSLQNLHRAHLGRMYKEGFADISGPFGDDQDVRGITIYNVPSIRMADSLANLDPMVKSGRLVIEIRPWWAGKGYPLR
tara:strand:- start:3 stop:503 length:501 start_codon:yes stop_codon:yes gene_type:complete